MIMILVVLNVLFIMIKTMMTMAVMMSNTCFVLR